MSYSLRYAGYISAAGPPTPTEWTGPPGPPGPPGQAFGSVLASQELWTAATVGASSQVLLIVLDDNVAAQFVQIRSTIIGGVDPNYNLEIWSGDPTAGGTMVYQATGITAPVYDDTVGFYVTAPPSSTLWLRIENVDAVATGVHVDTRYVAVAEN